MRLCAVFVLCVLRVVCYVCCVCCMSSVYSDLEDANSVCCADAAVISSCCVRTYKNGVVWWMCGGGRNVYI